MDAPRLPALFLQMREPFRLIPPRGEWTPSAPPLTTFTAMTPLRLTALALLAFFTSALPAADTAKFSEHPFFKHFVGSWKSAGELKGGDGNVIKITEEWVCTIDDEGGLLIEGTRQFNDGDVQKYRWNITHNSNTDLYEAVQTNLDDQANSMRFEGSVTGEPPVLELKGQFGNGGGSATVTDSFTGEGHNTIDTKVVLLKDDGEVNLEGTIKNERVK
jgi:hypothetical protein